MDDIMVECPRIHEEEHSNKCDICLGYGYRNLTAELARAQGDAKGMLLVSGVVIGGAFLLGFIIPISFGIGEPFLLIICIIVFVCLAALMIRDQVHYSTMNLHAITIECELAVKAPVYQEFLEWKARHSDRLIDDDEIVDFEIAKYEQKRKRR